MKFLCLCPTYGRPPHILNNALACFLRQTHPDKYLLFFDDLGNVAPVGGENWGVMGVPNRVPMLSMKYNIMVNTYAAMGHGFDAIAIWDDDDLYLPGYLANHAMALTLLGDKQWSHPEKVHSTYTGTPQLENATGRFHGSVACTRKAYVGVGGHPQIPDIDYDQKFIGSLQRAYGSPADAFDYEVPGYVFRWADSGANHCQTRAADPMWYAHYQPQHTDTIKHITPELDAPALSVFQHFGY